MRPPHSVAGASTELLSAPAANPPWPLVIYFHHVGPPYGHYTSVSLDEFRLVLDEIDLIGYLADPRSPIALSRCGLPVLLTFDDGFRDTVLNVVPLLEDRGASAAFFVNTDHVGRTICEPGRARGNEFATWSDLRSAAAAGMVVGSHGHRHVRWDQLSALEVRAEARLSYDIITRNIGTAPWGLAYPNGQPPLHDDELGEGVLRFATVRAPLTPWGTNRGGIRRVYLPAGASDTWRPLLRGWRDAWEH